MENKKHRKITDLKKLSQFTSGDVAQYFSSFKKIDKFYVAPTIRDTQETDISDEYGTVELAKEYVDEIVNKLIDDLGQYLASDYLAKKNQEKATVIFDCIMKWHSTRISLSGLADCFGMIKVGKDPCNLEVRGFDALSICKMIERYQKDYTRIRQQIQNKIKVTEETTGPRCKENVQQAISSFTQQHLKKFKIPETVEEQRRRYRESKKTA